mgnify:FL=1
MPTTSIIEAIERVDRYSADMDEAAFLNNRLVQDAVIRSFEVIVLPLALDLQANIP